ncbi:S46 family peptidase [Terrimonas pollutisoli]|uniref:S46 family peptidase n=1 Tax=Terrimonas pollutisoli TaxID=3034147 RepID=UPI0023EB95C4|nr:S46 family peptidase [Terrimonas sp. H1YJ31]
MKKVKLLILSILLIVSIVSQVKAGEGMWLPFLLEKLNEKEMKSMGMKISAKDIYDINKGSLKDAVVSFGGFCTGEVISAKGLVLTNHHCGFDAVQNHSTLDHNYIRDGFWAKTNAEELPNPTLYVTFIVRIDDVSKQVLNGVTAGMTEAERQSIIDKNAQQINSSVKKESYQSSFIKPFFEGNQYFLFVTETYNDVRLVGAPPSSIGNFGKDTDNWMWPRHTGDFSLFRIYAGKDNKPAAYSPGNVPYVPRKALSVSLDGVAENDFTMVFGFPGKTTEYLPSTAVQQIVDINDPAKIAIRDKALAVIDSFMRKDEQVKIQYAAKYASISNAWKKWQGEISGLKRTNGVDKKKNYEAQFQKRVQANPQWKTNYGTILDDLNAAYAELKPYGLARDYYLEITSKIELLAIASQLNSLVKAYEQNGEKGYTEQLEKVKAKLNDIYGEYNAEVDRRLFRSLMEMYIKDQPAEYIAPIAKNGWADQNTHDPGITILEALCYSVSDLPSADKVKSHLLVADPKMAVAAIKKDSAFLLYLDMSKTYNEKVAARLNEIQNRINQLQRTYMQAQMEVMKERKFYPDANSTLRVTYGNVKGYNARDAVKYDYYSYMEGLMEKYKPGDYEFDVPARLRELYQKKDFGQYGKNGRMPVCFIAANHTTGGNSGSPALDAYGNLIGLNFDRVWEGTMSDINYDPSICRNIMVDIRYVLFIIDKYAGAGHLVKEMKLVHPKNPAPKGE